MEHLHPQLAHAPVEFLTEIKQTMAVKKTKPKKGTKGMEG